MYDELYVAWRLEIENGDLGSLPSDFYARTTDYLRRIKEESKMLDKKNVRANLLEKEMANARRIVEELISARYRKLIKMVMAGRKVPSDSLTA